ncbi:CD99 antigen [Echinops telfairi]|uniref:CD99 antigen n=1 Tax=Echinops telfairi TaxID=9371 RepID=A0AC55CRF3_ECHTE|nr:CD99 antigen [Echinops telfairi]
MPRCLHSELRNSPPSVLMGRLGGDIAQDVSTCGMRFWSHGLLARVWTLEKAEGGCRGGGSPRDDGEQQADSPGVIPGIVGAVVVALAGAVSSFIAYQKKRLCFKEHEEQGDLNMENQQGGNPKTPAEHSLLQKA